jgi:NAD(P)-dependent dehydrogenase (short-subunit alcohol dehydrogenase family)
MNLNSSKGGYIKPVAHLSIQHLDHLTSKTHWPHLQLSRKSHHCNHQTMATYLITGASRGIGLELTRQLAELPTSQVSKIFAVVRKVDSKDVQQLVDSHPERVIPISASVDDTASVKKAAETVKSRLNGQGLDVLVNNAGVSDFSTDGIKSMDIDRLSRTLDVNVVGVHRVTAAFMPLLEQGTEKKIINMYVLLGTKREFV